LRTPLSQKNKQELVPDFGFKVQESKIVSTSKIARRLGMILLESKLEVEGTPGKPTKSYNPFE
jgi:hypothetical protein